MNNSAPQFTNRGLLTLSEFCAYLGIGKTKAREILSNKGYEFSFRVGNRLYVNKRKLDAWLECHDEF